MTTRELAKRWLKLNHPADILNMLRVSKHYPEKDIWFLTFPQTYFDSGKLGNLNILLQNGNDPEQFHFLKVPFSFFKDNQEKFDVRSTEEKFDLHISAKKRNWMTCERSKNISFNKYEQ